MSARGEASQARSKVSWYALQIALGGKARGGAEMSGHAEGAGRSGIIKTSSSHHPCEAAGDYIASTATVQRDRCRPSPDTILYAVPLSAHHPRQGMSACEGSVSVRETAARARERSENAGGLSVVDSSYELTVAPSGFF